MTDSTEQKSGGIADFLNRKKELLAAFAGLLVIILQIINTILSIDIENNLGAKALDMANKAEAIQKIALTQIDQSKSNSEALSTNAKALTGVGTEVHDISETLNNHIARSQQFSDLLRKSLKVEPTPSSTP